MADPHYPSRLAAAAVAAASVCDLFPGAQLIGSYVTAIDFSYDFLFSQPVDAQAIPLIEEKMRAVIKAQKPIHISEMMRENAAAYLEHLGQPLAAERLRANPENIVAILEIDGFRDFCPWGQELNWPATTDEIGAIKIVGITQEMIYLPDEGELAVTRLQGVAFPDPQKLKKFLKQREEAKKRDHLVLGEEMKLFSASDALAFGSFCWLPKGALLRDLVLGWWNEVLRKQNFEKISTPALVQCEDEGEVEIEGREFSLLPDRTRSHAFLYGLTAAGATPVRYAEGGERLVEVPRVERRGLFNSPIYWGDHLSLFICEEAIAAELISSLQFFNKTIKMFGFEHQWYLAARKGAHAPGTQNAWSRGTKSLVKAMQDCGFGFEEEELTSAQWGPRVEMRLSDARGQQWVGPWMGLVAQRPEELKRSQDMFMLHGALISSLERFMALLLEHFAGQLPLWLVPEQVRVLPIGANRIRGAEVLVQKMTEAGFRVGIDKRDEKLGGKVHAAERERIPYLIVVGEKEEKEGSITVRSSYTGEMHNQIRLEDFLASHKRGVERQVES